MSGSWPTPRRRRTSTSTPGRPTTRTSGSRMSPSATRTTTRSTTTRSTACCPATWSPRSTSSTPSWRVAPTPRRCRASAGISETTAGASRRRGRRPARGRRASTSRPAAGSEPEPGAAGEAAWVHDPQDLVPSTIVDPFSFLLEYPDEGEVAARPDVVVFTGEPLAAPLTLTGRVVAHLRVGSDGPSMCVHVKLVDVAPDGASHILLYGQELVDRPGEDDGGRRVPGAHRPSRPTRPPPPAPGRVERLPALRPPPRDVGEPVVRGRDGGQPPARPPGWLDAVIREPHRARRVGGVSRSPARTPVSSLERSSNRVAASSSESAENHPATVR